MGGARLLEARRLPNPELHLDVEDWLGSGQARGARLMQLTVQVSQDIELGGQRAARVRAVRVAARAMDWRVEALRLEVLARVTKAFLNVVHGQELVVLRAQLVENAAAVVKDLSDKEQAGRVLEPVVAQARIREQIARVAHRRAGASLEGARLALATLWGSHRPRFTRALGALGTLPSLPPLAVLLEGAQEHPSLREKEAVLAAERAQFEAERRGAWPALGLRAGYRYMHGEDASAVVLGVSLPLPLAYRNQGQVEVARVRVQQAALDRARVLAGHQSRLALAHGQIRLLSDEAEVLLREVLPASRQSFARIQEGYRLDRVTALELLEAGRTLIEVEEHTLGVLHRLQRAHVELGRLVGRLDFAAQGTEGTGPASPPDGQVTP